MSDRVWTNIFALATTVLVGIKLYYYYNEGSDIAALLMPIIGLLFIFEIYLLIKYLKEDIKINAHIKEQVESEMEEFVADLKSESPEQIKTAIEGEELHIPDFLRR